MKIIADSKIPFVQEAFADVAEVTALDTREIVPDVVREADALLVRSETTVDKSLLNGSRVRFVATATIGTDHLDTDYLQQRGIGFASAPGSNANSVGEYIVAALLVLEERCGFSLAGKTLGVVGVGNVGTIVVRYARALGLHVLQNDPPLARTTGNPAFLPLDELMDADIITIHVPLTKTGPDKTFHLFGDARIRAMKSGSILINTSRGGVVDTVAIKNALRTHHLAACVLDVWENEPTIDCELLSVATLGTPHIAGYSFDGKVKGTVMIHKAACEYFGLRSAWLPHDMLGQGVRSPIIVPEGSSHSTGLLAAIKSCYDIEGDDANLRRIQTLEESERGAFFRRLRAGYPMRREFCNHEVKILPRHLALVDTLRILGYKRITVKN
jgi:erythronate-4-phosphate dehydrogenase